jgi:hypothetical protein
MGPLAWLPHVTGAVEGATARRHPRVDLDSNGVVVEADRRAVRTGAEGPADVAGDSE